MTTQLKIEIQLSTGSWIDITTDVYQRDPVQVTQGRTDEQSQAQPSRLSFTLDNRDGRYSPRNPLSDLFGKIGRNTPVRATLDGVYPRFHGEVSSWPPRWDESHSDNYVPIEAYGILRRLGQGQPVVSNALRDWVLAQPTLKAYYTLSGGEETIYSQNVAPGKTGSFRAANGPIFAYGKDMGAAWLGTGMELSSATSPAYMEGGVNATAQNVALDFVFQSPALGVLDVRLFDTSDSYWNLRLNTSTDDGTAQGSYYDDTNGLITDTVQGPFAALQDTNLHTCRLLLKTISGPVRQYVAYIDGQIVASANLVTGTLQGFYLFRLFYSRFTGHNVMNIAHLAAWADDTLANIPSATDFYNAAFAYAGESAVSRVTRIANAGGFLISVGASDPTLAAKMGPQYTETRLDSIRECEATDMGLLFEDPGSTALEYWSRTTLYNQTPAFTLDYSALQVNSPLEPVDDDQTTRNDVTASRREGGSSRYTVDTGPMSTQDPPNGVGRYDTDITVNPETDGMLGGIAAWVANIGTLDKARWPSVTVNLANPAISSTLRNQIKASGVGSWFTITKMQQVFVYDDITLVIVGYSEVIDTFSHVITFVCMPADPYKIGIWSPDASAGTMRWDADGSALGSSVTSTATSFTVVQNGSTLWTTDAAAFPFDVLIGGERMTVTNITSATSPQTFTATRSVNGVVKAHPSGESVVLFDTPRYGL